MADTNHLTVVEGGAVDFEHALRAAGHSIVKDMKIEYRFDASDTTALYALCTEALEERLMTWQQIAEHVDIPAGSLQAWYSLARTNRGSSG